MKATRQCAAFVFFFIKKPVFILACVRKILYNGEAGGRHNNMMYWRGQGQSRKRRVCPARDTGAKKAPVRNAV